jgi:quercetin dioxygenase-like cupin family protein
MKLSNINEFTNGWFVGSFEPALFKTNAVEVALKKYKKGSYEERHYHKIATEITIIVEGQVVMNDRIYKANDILTISPGESTDFKVLEDTVTVVVKLPGAENDKYLGENK